MRVTHAVSTDMIHSVLKIASCIEQFERLLKMLQCGKVSPIYRFLHEVPVL